MYRRRGTAAAPMTPSCLVPQAPVLDFATGDHENGGFDVASQSVPDATDGLFTLYVCDEFGAHCNLEQQEPITDPNPHFVDLGIAPGSIVYVVEYGAPPFCEEESLPSNQLTI